MEDDLVFCEWDFRGGPDPDFDRGINTVFAGLSDKSCTNPIVPRTIIHFIHRLRQKDTTTSVGSFGAAGGVDQTWLNFDAGLESLKSTALRRG
jgi:hypothetical protein